MAFTVGIGSGGAITPCGNRTTAIPYIRGGGGGLLFPDRTRSRNLHLHVACAKKKKKKKLLEKIELEFWECFGTFLKYSWIIAIAVATLASSWTASPQSRTNAARSVTSRIRRPTLRAATPRQANEVDEAGVRDLGEDLNLVFGETGAVAAISAFGGVVFRGAGGDKFGRFDGGEELVSFEGCSVDSAVAASAQEGVGGVVGGGDDVINE
ncbi:hypothetical protein HKD37_09G026025 [Glycine soja]